MPIRPELRQFYQGRQWQATRARILERARHRCEWCGKPNHRWIFVYNGRHDRQARPIQYWLKMHGRVWRIAPTGKRAGDSARVMRGLPARVYVVLTIAHLNHTPGDDRDDNLKALCQWCHLWHDRQQHRASRSERKDRARPLISELMKGEACHQLSATNQN